MVTKERSQWVDSCRFFAIFVIMCTHFLAEFYPDALRHWEEGALSWLLYGLTGKFSVAFFFVLLGYFAAKPAVFSPGAFITYSIRRYVQFAFYILLCGAAFIIAGYGLTWLFHMPGGTVQRLMADGAKYNLIYMLRDGLLFEANYNDTLWCMQQLFLASLLCRMLGYLPRRLGLMRLIPAAAAMLLLMLLDGEFCVWICAALLGYILRLCLEDMERKGSQPRSIFLLLMGLLALLLIKIRMAESVLQYCMQSVSALLLIFVQFYLPPVQRLLSSKPFPWLGGISMGLFVVHTPINALLLSSVYPGLGGWLPEGAALMLCCLLSLGLSIAAAGALHRLYDALITSRRKTSLSV